MTVEELRRTLDGLPGDQVVKIVNESDVSGVNAHDELDVGTFRLVPSESPGCEYVPDTTEGAVGHADLSSLPGYIPFEDLQRGVVLFFDSRTD